MHDRFMTFALLLVAAIYFLSFSLITPTLALDKAFRIDTSASCLTSACHNDYAKQKHVHPAASDGGPCAALCHQPVKENRHEFTPLPSKISDTCYQCHEKIDKKHVHNPVEDGMCTMCHDPHQADNTKLLKMPLPELCFTCHSAQLKDSRGRTLPATKSLFDDKQAVLHQPFEAGSCSICHQPHASTANRLMTGNYPGKFYSSYSPDAYGLCFTCHSSKAFEVPRTLTETEFRNGNLNLHYRHVNRQKGRSCNACHNHHGSRQPKLVRQAFQFGAKTLPLKYEKTESGGSCATACHAPLKYDRCEPEANTLRTTQREGRDASMEDLRTSCEKEKNKK